MSVERNRGVPKDAMEWKAPDSKPDVSVPPNYSRERAAGYRSDAAGFREKAGNNLYSLDMRGGFKNRADHADKLAVKEDESAAINDEIDRRVEGLDNTELEAEWHRVGQQSNAAWTEMVSARKSAASAEGKPEEPSLKQKAVEAERKSARLVQESARLLEHLRLRGVDKKSAA